MAVAIRLRREGTRNRAFYRIVVADSRARRDGRFIESIGTYDPQVEGTNYKVDVARASDWISKGAQPSDTVSSILKKARRDAANAPAAEEEAPAAAAPFKKDPTPEPAPVKAAAAEPVKEEAVAAEPVKKEVAAAEPAPAEVAAAEPAKEEAAPAKAES
jgi:small subunit ribosomal protein S16